ncbi:MAG: hypothetical protein JOZ48_08440 [Acidobacteriaceae bacterium]|nr:hypothetical protein [Acidobacteriaceae bacterium]
MRWRGRVGLNGLYWTSLWLVCFIDLMKRETGIDRDAQLRKLSFQEQYTCELSIYSIRLKGYVMRLFTGPAIAAALVLFSPALFSAQGQMEGSRAVEGGGISVPGWTGKVDAKEESAGQTLNNAKLSSEGNVLHVTTGPAVTYWNPVNRASGDYTVKATFTEPKYMNLNTHPHPYGIVIAGNDLGTPQQSYLYCAAYGNGTFIVRGFGPEPFQMNGRRGEENAAVHKAAGQGEPVTQEIAVSVKGGEVSCAINGTVVAKYDKAALVTAGKLKSTDGIYGIRFAHNTDATVTGLTVTKNQRLQARCLTPNAALAWDRYPRRAWRE